MATMDDILGNGGGTPPPKGSKELHEQQQDAPSVSSPAKGTQKWTEQQAAAAPAVTGSQSETVAAPPAKQADVNGGSLSYAELYKNSIPINRQRTRNLLKKRRSRNVNRYSQPLVMVYRHSRTCSSPRSTLQICIPVRIPCQNVPK